MNFYTSIALSGRISGGNPEAGYPTIWFRPDTQNKDIYKVNRGKHNVHRRKRFIRFILMIFLVKPMHFKILFRGKN